MPSMSIEERLRAVDSFEGLKAFLVGIQEPEQFPEYDMIVLDAVNCMQTDIELTARGRPIPVVATRLNVPLSDTFQEALTFTLQERGWDVAKRDNGFRAFFDNSRKLQLRPRNDPNAQRTGGNLDVSNIVRGSSTVGGPPKKRRKYV
jgi:hypothetical protein